MLGKAMSQTERPPVSNPINILATRLLGVVSNGCHSGHKFSRGRSGPLFPLFLTIYFQYRHCEQTNLNSFLLKDRVARHICDASFQTLNDLIFVWFKVCPRGIIESPSRSIRRFSIVASLKSVTLLYFPGEHTLI